jgi:cytochrome c6
MAKQAWMLNAGRISTLVIVGVCFGGMPLRAAGSGAALFKSKCAACHGADGKGETPVGKMYKLRALGSADVQKQSDGELTSIISKGKNKMPAYGSLKEDEIKDLVSYIRAFAKK